MTVSRGLRAAAREEANAALAEALFSLSEMEPPGDRRVALLKAGYAAFDADGHAQGPVLDTAPDWLRPLVSQLLACRGRDALDAAVQRLSGGATPRRRVSRERYLSRADVQHTLREAPDHLRPERQRGAWHWHTTDSDGKATLETMARACHRRGATWASVTDHSRGLEVASGLDREGVRLQRRRIEAWNRRHGDDLRLFQGLEIEVLEDGGLDVPAGERLEIDVVNLWPNRLIGDDALPPAERLTVTNATAYTRDSALMPSGLLGPVTLQESPRAAPE